MAVFKYTEAVQKYFKAKTKPEPWLHVIIANTDKYFGSMFAIYVWDTRQIIETGKCNVTPQEFRKVAKPAIDSKKPLVGEHAEFFNSAFAGHKGLNGYKFIVYDEDDVKRGWDIFKTKKEAVEYYEEMYDDGRREGATYSSINDFLRSYPDMKDEVVKVAKDN